MSRKRFGPKHGNAGATRASGQGAFWTAAGTPVLAMSLVLLCALVLFSEPDALFQYPPDNLRILIVTVAATLALLSLLIRSGLQTSQALDAERKARTHFTDPGKHQ